MDVVLRSESNYNALRVVEDGKEYDLLVSMDNIIWTTLADDKWVMAIEDGKKILHLFDLSERKELLKLDLKDSIGLELTRNDDKSKLAIAVIYNRDNQIVTEIYLVEDSTVNKIDTLEGMYSIKREGDELKYIRKRMAGDDF